MEYPNSIPYQARLIMRIALCVACGLFVWISNATAQKPADKEKRIKELKDEIAKTQAKLKELTQELQKIEPQIQRQFAPGTLRHEEFKVGLVGKWKKGEYGHKVTDVIDESSARVMMLSQPRIELIVKGVSTKGIVDGSTLPLDGLWEFTGTMKIAGTTYFVIEPYVEK